MRRPLRVVLALATLTVAAIGLVAVASAHSSSPKRDLVRAMIATAKYHSVARAERDGYVEMSPCEKSPAGGMGHHYVNVELLMDPGLDVTRPEILLYAPGRNGKLRLVGVEYWRVDADQNLATDPDRPYLFGRPFDGPMLGHAPGMPIHYDLHVWIWRHNPSGIFSMWNPRVHCP